MAASVTAALATPPAAPYDVVFLDPPYPLDDSSARRRSSPCSSAQGWLVPGAMVVVERSSRSPEPRWPAGVTGTRSKRYGETTLWYGHAAASPEEES